MLRLRRITKSDRPTLHSVWPPLPCEQRTAFPNPAALTKTQGDNRPNGTWWSQVSTITKDRLFRIPAPLRVQLFRRPALLRVQLIRPPALLRVQLFRHPAPLRVRDSVWRVFACETTCIFFGFPYSCETTSSLFSQTEWREAFRCVLRS